MKVCNVKELVVWQKSMRLVTEVYSITNNLPKSEMFALSNQIRRAVVSIPSNISEGFYRGGTKEYLNFLRISSGSCAEVETQLLIIGNIYPSINIEAVLLLKDEVHKMLNKMITNVANLKS
jgi:four helix bundle protein